MENNIKDFNSLMLILKEHFEEDNRRNFKRIDDTQAKYNELIAINGENISNMSARLGEVKDLLIEQNKTFKNHVDQMDAHMKRVEPVIRKFEEDKIADAVLKERGTKIFKGIVSVGMIIGAWHVIKTFIIAQFK